MQRSTEKVRDKSVVLFDKRKRAYIITLPDGSSVATLFPLNHPDINHVSNTKMVITSEVVNIERYDGRIIMVETKNTIYKESE
jgi:hypothetical protein